MNASLVHAAARRRARLLPAFAAMAPAVAALPVAAQAWAPYDDFVNSTLVPSRWHGEDGRLYGALRMESRRAVVNGQLRLELRSFGDNARSEGVSSARQSVVFARSTSITAMKARVTMRNAAMGACAGVTTSEGSVVARLFGHFFNAGTTIEGSLMNEAFAGVQVFRTQTSPDAPGLFRVAGFMGVCTDDSCTTTKPLGFVTLAEGVALNQPVDVSVAWDGAANLFRFGADAAQGSLAYSLADDAPSTLPVKRMEVVNTMQQCAGIRIVGVAAADFDNVQTNPAE